MSQEVEPRTRQTPKDERDELAKLEAELARKKIEVEGSTNFGKYDTVAPNKGEDTWSSYKAQRPDDGIIRDTEGYRDVKTGKFAAQEAYIDQTAPKNEILDMLKDPGERAEVDYSTKSRTELIKLAADAKELGDRAESEDIRAVFEHNLMEEYTREIGAGMTEQEAEAERLRYAGVDRTDEQFNSELAQFDSEIDKLLALRSQKNNTESINTVEVAENQDGFDETDDNQGMDEESAEEKHDSVETKAELELKVGDRVTYKDMNGNVIEGKIVAVLELDNEDYMVYSIETDDGRTVFVSYAYIIAGESEPGVATKEENGEKTESSTELNFGNYPELYAQRKNLASTEEGRERLEAEGRKVAENMNEHVSARLADFMEHNPDASEEQIKQAAMGFYLEAQNGLEREILEHIDGIKVDGREARGAEGILRRFGAWMDRHGSKIKKGLLIAGGIGLAATGVGLAAGAITIGAAVGVGTAIGAIKGTAIGALLQRHGSKESASHQIDLLQNEESKALIADLDPADRQTFEAYSAWIMRQFDSAAEQDHSKNIKKTATAAVIGGALGAIAGSLQIDTLSSHDVTTSTDIPNSAPEVVSHQIAPGELSGQVLDKLLVDNKINLEQFLQTHNIVGAGDSFTLPDGSTNIGLIHAVENALGPDFGTIGQTHSFAGADALSNDGIRSIFEAIHGNANWGSHTVSTTTTVNDSDFSWPWTILTAGSASLVGDGVAKLIGDRVGRRQQIRVRQEQ